MSSQVSADPELNVSICQKRRALFLVQVLQRYDVQDVAKGMGITDTRFVTRLVQDLRQHASIAEAPRSGRPVLYTNIMLEHAQAFMLEGVDAAWSKEDIVAGMIEVGILPEDTSVDGFWERFAGYMRQQGTPVVYGCQLLTFAMSRDHISGRHRWCHHVKHKLTEERIGRYWFVDEVAIEESGLPKGE